MPFPIKMSLTLETFLVTLLFIYAFSFYLLYFLSCLQCSVPKLHSNPEVLAHVVRQETSRQPLNRERDQGGEAASSPDSISADSPSGRWSKVPKQQRNRSQKEPRLHCDN